MQRQAGGARRTTVATPQKLLAPSADRQEGSDPGRAWSGGQASIDDDAGTTVEVHQSPAGAHVESRSAGVSWIAGAADDTAIEDTPVRSYEGFVSLGNAQQRHAAAEEAGPFLGPSGRQASSAGPPAQSGSGMRSSGDEAHELTIAEQEIELKVMEGKLQSVRCQLEVQRQTSAKLAKMCKENKEEYEICVQRLTDDAEAERLRAHAVEQELNKRIQALEQVAPGKEPKGYVSIHGFYSGATRRENMKKEEYVEHLETDTARLKQKVADLTAKLSKANVRGVKAETQLEKARSEHRSALDSMQQAQMELQNRLADKETLVQALRNESDTRVWGVDKIREQYRDLELDRARLQQACEEMKVERAQHEVDVTQLHIQQQKLQMANKELEDGKTGLKWQLEDARSRVQQVEAMLLNARKGDDELLHENRGLSARLATVTFQYEELERAVSEVHARHKAEDAEALSRMHREQLETRNKLQMLETELQTTQMELKRTKTMMQAEIDNLQSKNKALENATASEQAEASRKYAQTAQTHATEIAMLRDQQQGLVEKHTTEAARKDRQYEREKEKILEQCRQEVESIKRERDELQRKLQAAQETAQETAQEMQQRVAAAQAETNLVNVAMSQTTEEREVQMLNLREEHQKAVTDLLSQLAERDARISELSSKLENLHDTLRESSRKVQTSEGESEVQSRRMAALEKRVHGVEATKAGLERQLDVANRLHDELEAKLRVSESQRSTLEVSVLQMTETISALSSQISELESLKLAEANRASSLEMKLSLEADARLRAEELAVEAVRWKEERVQYQWEGNGANKSLEHDDSTELHSLRKMVLHLESRISDKSSKREGDQVASLQRQLDSYQERAKQWEALRQQLCTRVAQLEGKQSAASAHQQHDAVQARKFEILAAQRAEENTGLRRRMVEMEEEAATHQLELDKLQSRLTSSYNELKSARAEHDLCKRSHAMERAQLKKCEADLRLASGNAAQAERAHDEMRQEKDRLSRVNSQLAGELSALRIKLGNSSLTHLATSLNTSGNSNRSPSRRALHASALGLEGDIPSFREISPPSAYHASIIGSHVGAGDISNVSGSSGLDLECAYGHRQDDLLGQIRLLVQQERRGEEREGRISGTLSSRGAREGAGREISGREEEFSAGSKQGY